ncbi:DNA helicase-2/ATP-dependent DNA helicase PcrA [Evansella vedderi]|uniref:DNA 3'-5' helicase n=1 Tax=Evansella vedderi TaxID=38282 RepID=A0ABT9ZRK0_9BACI|nr:ATP-dependent helicase [Evansella vedderi]MDQ0253494.1 DNA helicase-2/ATP-dependent DNA helicase PcrA [Evansella vedderi]
MNRLSGEVFFERKKQEIGVSLNEVQKKAVLHTEGQLLLLASPGSGKTTTIIMRIGYLITEKGADPSRIKGVTFSKASAMDMKDRFQRFFPELAPVDFSTIHSLAFEITREYFYKKRLTFDLIEGDANKKNNGPQQLPLNKKLILRNLFEQLVGDKITEDQMDELTTYISFIKNKLLPKGEWASVKCEVPRAQMIFQEYEKLKRSQGTNLLLDYDDMLTIANHAMEKDLNLLRKYQNRYDYVLTDESQDTSMVQHAIIEKLVKEHGNLCVVADDDQSIYTWRAAEPQYLLNFKEVFPDAEILMMEQNYRSSKDIVDVANQFIKRNKQRYDKNMFTENPSQEPIRIQTLTDYKFQAKYVVQAIKERTGNYSDVAVLFRNNSSSIILMNEMDRAGIPFYLKDSDNRFFSHWVVEDILNFMRMSFNMKRADIFERIGMKMDLYISKSKVESLKLVSSDLSVFDQLLASGELKGHQVKKLKEAKKVFQEMKGAKPLPVIRMIRTDLGYEKVLEKICERLGFKMDYLNGILNTLEEIADTLETMEDFAKRLQYLEGLLKSSKFNKGKNVVTFSTLHSSKGLEFKEVYMIDLIDGIIPSQDDIDSYRDGELEMMEEAVRLFYVGMTRAQQKLVLVTYSTKDFVRVRPSQFVRDVKKIMNPPKEKRETEADTKKKSGISQRKKFQDEVVTNPNAIKEKELLKEGETVKHRVFGRGKIVKVDHTHIIMQFPKVEKKLLLQMCLDMGLLEPLENETTQG